MARRQEKFIYVWEYTVPAEHTAAFERAYGPAGDWVELFRKAEGYEHTELHRDVDTPGRYLTIDYWVSRAARDEFRRRFQREFDALDDHCERLTSRERQIGEFHHVAPNTDT